MQRKTNELCHCRNVLHGLLPSVLKLNLDSQELRLLSCIYMDHVDRAREIFYLESLVISKYGILEIQNIFDKIKGLELWNF